MPFWVVYSAMMKPPEERRWLRLGPGATMTYCVGPRTSTGAQHTRFPDRGSAEAWLREDLPAQQRPDEPWTVTRVVGADTERAAIMAVQQDPLLRAARRAGWHVERTSDEQRSTERLALSLYLCEPRPECRSAWEAALAGCEDVRIVSLDPLAARALAQLDALVLTHRAAGENYGGALLPFRLKDGRLYQPYPGGKTVPNPRWVIARPPAPGADSPGIEECTYDIWWTVFAHLRAFNESEHEPKVRVLGILCPYLFYGLVPGAALQGAAVALRRAYDAHYGEAPQDSWS